MTPFRLMFVAMIATVLLIGARSGAEAQFPRGLLAAVPTADPKKGSCAIETRPLSFGTYDPESTQTWTPWPRSSTRAPTRQKKFALK